MNTKPYILALTFLISACSEESSLPVAGSDAGNWVAQELQTEAFADACENTPGCDEVNGIANQEMQSVWRVRVVRSAAGEVSIGEAERIELGAEDGLPVGALYGQYALVGLDSDGEVIGGYALRFPDTLRIEGEGGVEYTDLSDKAVDTIAYLPTSPDIRTLAIQDPAGQILHSVPAPVEENRLSLHWSRFLGVTPALAVTRPFQGLPQHCSHVIVLQGETDRRLAGGVQFEDTVELVQPGPYQLAAAQAALARMTPLLCQSIARIAFGRVPDRDSVLGAVQSFGAGDMVLINVAGSLAEEALQEMVNRRLMLQGTLTHEAGHAAETLLTFESSEPGNYVGSWSFPARTLADKTVKNVRLEMGLPEEWKRLHESFVAHDWAKPYGSFAKPEGGEPAPEWTAEQIVAGGFISQYASKNWAEDIANFVGHTYLSRPMTDAYQDHGVADSLREDKGCMVMRKYQEKNLPSRYAAVYTKLKFIQGLGLVRPEDVDDCTGGKLGLPIEGEGFHVWKENMQLRSFQNGVKARLGTRQNGAKVFTLEAKGEAGFADKTYPADVRLQLDLGTRFKDFDKVSWPRGVYELGLLGDNNFTLRLDGAKAGNFDAMDGFVLVADSSSKRIAGSVVLQRVMRLQAPLPVPELYDPPLVFRFLIEK